MNEVENEIRAARAILRPSAVRLHHIPGWFSKALASFGRRGMNSAHTRLDTAARWAVNATGTGYERWLDHWGSSRITHRQFGRPPIEIVAFVSEPYGFSDSSARQLDAIASQCPIRWCVESNSYWYPGHTVRIVITPRDL